MEEKYYVDANSMAADLCSSVLILNLENVFVRTLEKGITLQTIGNKNKRSRRGKGTPDFISR